MYEYTPKTNKKIPYIIVFFCLVSGIVLFMPSTLSEDLSLWLRVIGIWAFAAAFIVTDRYLFTSYTYIIDQKDDGSVDFIVSELHFKKHRTVCRIAVGEIAAISRIEKGKKPALPKKTRIFNYQAELFSQSYHLLRVENTDGEFFIKFSPDLKIISLISELSCHK